jgi:hypothetical protein
MAEHTTKPAASQQHAPIHASMLVSEINEKFPQCSPVFDRYGLGGCGGQLGPPEPLFIFAAAHRVPLKQLVDELNAAARGQWTDGGRRAEAAAALDEQAAGEILHQRFIFGSLLIALTLGMTLGAINLTRIAWAQSYASISGVLKQIHGHAQIFGWAGLFIMGVALHAVPRFKMAALKPLVAAKACFVMMLSGVALRGISQPWADAAWGGVLLAGSGLLELAAIASFVGLIARVVLRSAQAREFHEKFIWAGLLWFAALGVWNAWLTAQMAVKGWSAAPALQNALFIHAAFFGFIANMIFGFSLRVLPHFMGLRDSRAWAANAAFVLWNAAIFLRYPNERLAAVATWLEVGGAVMMVFSLRLFEKRKLKVQIEGVDGAFQWFIYMGYLWLLVAAATPLHADIYRLSASSRHLMAVGFVTSMILGVAHRVLPVFNGVNLWSNRLMRLAFWHLLAGTTIALAMAFNRAYGGAASYAWAAACGWLVLAAVAMFAWNLWHTLRARAEKFSPDAEVKPATRLADLLELFPELRPVLIHGGLSGLARMRGLPPRFVTIELAARRHGINPGPLIESLNAEIQRRKSK